MNTRTDHSTEDSIVKTVELDASPARVWQALTNHEEFGRWFRVRLDGPFVPGTVSTGRITYPGHEGAPWRATVERMDHERLFSFRWPVYDEALGDDLSQRPTTLVEFRQEPTETGTRLTITESGFSALPDPVRLNVLRGNTRGWDIQSGHITAHLSS